MVWVTDVTKEEEKIICQRERESIGDFFLFYSFFQIFYNSVNEILIFDWINGISVDC